MKHKTLAKAIIYGNLDDVKQHIQMGADINQLDEYGYNPMVETAIMRKTEMAELLLQQGAHVDAPDLTGRTALHWAADNHQLPLCRLLLKHKANSNEYSFAGQPVLAYPYLRKQVDLKNLLYKHGASLDYMQDYLNAKLLGHRFALQGQTHIINPVGDFILLDFEGFIFEFTSSLIQDSLQRFMNNYAAKHLQHYAKQIKRMLESLQVASDLIRYQQYSVKIEKHAHKIHSLLDHDLLLLPIPIPGHALMCIRYGNLFVKCDRGEYGRDNHTVTVYKIKQPQKLTKALMKQMLYKDNPDEFIHYELNDICGLEPIHSLPIAPQIAGNCSWANVEAAIPAMLFLLSLEEQPSIVSIDRKNLNESTQHALSFFQAWLDWDQDRAIDECIQSFHAADKKRKATKVQILAHIFVHRCSYQIPKDIERAGKILPIIRTPGYEYMLKAYIQEYTRDKKNPVGRNLMNLLDIAA